MIDGSPRSTGRCSFVLLIFFRSVPITTSSLQVSEATDKELENRKSLKKNRKMETEDKKRKVLHLQKWAGPFPTLPSPTLITLAAPPKGVHGPPSQKNRKKKLIRRLPRSSGFDSMASAKRRPSWPPWGSTAPPPAERSPHSRSIRFEQSTFSTHYFPGGPRPPLGRGGRH